MSGFSHAQQLPGCGAFFDIQAVIAADAVLRAMIKSRRFSKEYYPQQ